MENATGNRRSLVFANALRWSFVVICVLVSLLVTLYAATPWLISRLGPRLAEQFGIEALEVSAGYPKWRGIRLENLTVAADEYLIRGEDVQIGYSWSALRAGRLDSIEAGLLDISVFAATEPGADVPEPAAKPLIPAMPFSRLHAGRLLLRFPDTGFVGIGQADLGEGELSFSLDGMEPEVASRFSITAQVLSDGNFSARFGERDVADAEFLAMRGALAADSVSLQADINLSGYPLLLASEFARLPRGTGKVIGEIRTSVPWPLSESMSWQEIVATLPSISVEWISVENDLELYGISGSAQLDRGKLTASLSGALRYRIDDLTVTAQLPTAYAVDTQNGLLKGGRGLRLRVQQDGADAKATFRSFLLDTTTSGALDFDADVAGRLDTVQVDGRLKGELSLARPDPLTREGRLDFTGKLRAGDEEHAGVANAQFTLNGDALSADGMLTSGEFKDVPVMLDYDLATGAGVFRATKTFRFRQPVAVAFSPGWREAYDLDAGRIDAALKLTWRTVETVAAELTLALSEGRAHYEDYLASGISGRLLFTAGDAFGASDWRLAPTSVVIQRVDIGFPIDNMLLGLGWSGDRIDVAQARASVLGGYVTTSPFVYDIPTGSAAFDLALKGVDLSQVLALEGDDIKGTGRLNGALPVVVKNNTVQVNGGRVAAEAPGGTIRLAPTLAGLGGQSSLNFALIALQDFSYSELTAEISYAESGDLALAVHLLGRNPAVEKGRPIRYNLSISENLPVLLRSLRLQDEVNERIEKKVRK